MKDITKLIRRFVGILLLSTVLVIVLNIIILAAISASQTANGRPWTTAKETAEALQETETGYTLEKAAALNRVDHFLRQSGLLCGSKACGGHNRADCTLHDIEQGKH